MARKTGTHEEVINAFVNGHTHPYEGANVFAAGDVLYSYGKHFALAVRTPQGVLVINGDKYSVSTSKHQSIVRNEARGVPQFTTSFSALTEWTRPGFRGVEHMLLDGTVCIVDYTHDRSGGDYGERVHEDEIPMGATVFRREGLIVGWHMAASALFRLQVKDGNEVLKEKYGVAGMDEQQFFVSTLPHSVLTVEEAFDALKPDRVRREEQRGYTVPRQGEWFFIQEQVEKPRREYELMEKQFHLVGKNGGSPHTATRGIRKGDDVYVSGQIHHHEHRVLRLSTSRDPLIFQAVENTALESFSANGRVD